MVAAGSPGYTAAIHSNNALGVHCGFGCSQQFHLHFYPRTQNNGRDKINHQVFGWVVLFLITQQIFYRRQLHIRKESRSTTMTMRVMIHMTGPGTKGNKPGVIRCFFYVHVSEAFTIPCTKKNRLVPFRDIFSHHVISI